MPAGCFAEPLGVVTRAAYCNMTLADDPALRVTAWPPGVDEEFPEWLDLLEAVRDAGETFTMVELGAGFGRWIARAGVACRRRGVRDVQLVGVEAEAAHFDMMRQHLGDNGLLGPGTTLRCAAVDVEPGRVPFHMGRSAEWYGQAIARGHSAGPSAAYPDAWIEEVEAISLEQVLGDLEHVNLLDLDVQGVEAEVLGSVRGLLDRKVGRVHIGTHSTAIEAELRELYNALGWRCRHDYACGETLATPWGEVSFGDGVQSWINPAFGAGSR